MSLSRVVRMALVLPSCAPRIWIAEHIAGWDGEPGLSPVMQSGALPWVTILPAFA